MAGLSSGIKGLANVGAGWAVGLIRVWLNVLEGMGGVEDRLTHPVHLPLAQDWVSWKEGCKRVGRARNGWNSAYRLPQQVWPVWVRTENKQIAGYLKSQKERNLIQKSQQEKTKQKWIAQYLMDSLCLPTLVFGQLYIIVEILSVNWIFSQYFLSSLPSPFLLLSFVLFTHLILTSFFPPTFSLFLPFPFLWVY